MRGAWRPFPTGEGTVAPSLSRSPEAILGPSGLPDAELFFPIWELLDGLIAPLQRRIEHVHMKPESEEKVHELRLGSGLLYLVAQPPLFLRTLRQLVAQLLPPRFKPRHE